MKIFCKPQSPTWTVEECISTAPWRCVGGGPWLFSPSPPSPSPPQAYGSKVTEACWHGGWAWLGLLPGSLPTHPHPRGYMTCVPCERSCLNTQRGGDPSPPTFQHRRPLHPSAPPKLKHQGQFDPSATLFQSRHKSFPNNKYKKIIIN